MSFSELGLSAELLRAVKDAGYSQPTPIQTKAIPVVLEGHDVLAGAQTGTGKTASFTLPLLHRLQTTNQNRRGKHVRALVITPTRELAAQIHESIRTYGRHLPFRTTVVTGGVSINPQIDKLRRSTDVLVATPGRLLDHMSQGTVDLSGIEILVLDEADRMLDMGFIRDIRKILDALPRERQNLLFSATFSDEIKQLAAKMLNSPVEIQVAAANSTADRVEQSVYRVDRKRKRELLSHCIGARNWQQVLVFTRTRRGADKLARDLVKDGLRAEAIHGQKSQGARTKALEQFKTGKLRVLVATDVAARGLDISRLPHVINFELPEVAEDYVHRIGRTARAGEAGEAISLVCADERNLLRGIERLLKREIPQIVLPGYEPTETEATSQRTPQRKPRSHAPRAHAKPAPRPHSHQSQGRRASRDRRGAPQR
jgi:ATP-dependent RNA helicase RhlE